MLAMNCTCMSLPFREITDVRRKTASSVRSHSTLSAAAGQAGRTTSHTEPTTSKPRRAYQCRGQSSAAASRTTRSQPAAAARSSARARTASAWPRPRRRGIGQHGVDRRRRAVEPQLTGRDDPAVLPHDQVGHRHDRVVQALPADQLGDHPRPGPDR